MGPATNGSSGEREELLSTYGLALDSTSFSELELLLELDDSFWEELENSLLDDNSLDDDRIELDELDSTSEEDDDF